MAELKKIHYSHDAMIELIAANPSIRQREIASHFGLTESWVSQIINSDIVREKIAARRSDLMGPFLMEMEEKFRALADHSMQVIQERLEIDRSADLAVKALDLSTRSLGYGARSGVTINNNQQFVVAMPPPAADAGSWISEHRPTLVESRAHMPLSINLDTVIDAEAA